MSSRLRLIAATLAPSGLRWFASIWFHYGLREAIGALRAVIVNRSKGAE